ncbi:LPS export ABC transporter periplasmic protein LptC [Candidatus Pelagibacter sp.]|nr:LPS export ABC transporter periplasmic protein LptC [Candidatus Pelagibacter sp.]
MHKKTYIQISLFTIVFILIALTFNFYKSDQIKNKKTTNNNKKILEKDETLNVIENLSYSSKDTFGNQYNIIAKKGNVSLENKDIIFMTDVKAVINMNNSEPIYIKSDFADYNSKNYDTFFKDNIFLNHLMHQVRGEKLNLLFKTNLVTMSDSLIYTNINTILYADKFEMDLITKDSKIFMDNKSKKIKISISE